MHSGFLWPPKEFIYITATAVISIQPKRPNVSWLFLAYRISLQYGFSVLCPLINSKLQCSIYIKDVEYPTNSFLLLLLHWILNEFRNIGPFKCRQMSLISVYPLWHNLMRDHMLICSWKKLPFRHNKPEKSFQLPLHIPDL